MVNPTLERELHLQLENLLPPAQQKVLEFAKALVMVRPRPMNKQDLLSLAGSLSDEEAKEMMEAIDEDCGQVDLNAW